MKKDGRTHDRKTQEIIRLMAVERILEGEDVSRVMASYGLCRTTAYNKGAFWFATYKGGLTGEIFVDLLKALMYRRRKPLHLVVDGLPAHKSRIVRDYVSSTEGRLSLHFLPGYAPELNPDELVWSHAKRTGVARKPLQKGEKLEERVRHQLQAIANNRKLVRSFFQHPSVPYITDC